MSCVLDGPVVADLTTALAADYGTAAILCALADARTAAEVLAGMAIDYAVAPAPADALADVLAMLGLTRDPMAPLQFGRPA